MKRIFLSSLALTAILSSNSQAMTGREGGGVAYCAPIAAQAVQSLIQAQTGTPGRVTDNRLIGATGAKRVYEVTVISTRGEEVYDVTTNGGTCAVEKIELK